MFLEIATSIQLIRLQLLQKSTSNVKPEVMMWMGMFSKDASDHKSKQAVNQETYLKECMLVSEMNHIDAKRRLRCAF